jgi:hypothetical protein
VLHNPIVRLLAAVAVAFAIGRFGRSEPAPARVVATTAVAPPAAAQTRPHSPSSPERARPEARPDLQSPDPATVAGDGRRRSANRLVSDLERALARGEVAPTEPAADVPAETAAEVSNGIRAALAERNPLP